MGNNSNGSANNVLEKVGILLTKTKEALIRDLQQEFVGVRTAIEKYEEAEKKDDKLAMTKCFIPIIDAVFAKVGYDISHYEELGEVRAVVEKLIGVTEQIAKLVEDGSKIDDDGEITADEIAGLAAELMPLIQEVLELVRMVCDIEWSNVKSDLEQSTEDVGTYIRENILTKDFARKVLDHILMTLLKNAKVVFKDEIEFAKFTIESGVKELVSTAEEMTNAIKKNLNIAGTQLQNELKLIESTMKETLTDATKLYDRMKEQIGADANDLQALAEQYKGTYVKIANAMSITYSILEFLGVLEEKEFNLTLPTGLKEALGKIQDGISTASEKITDAVDTASGLVADSTATMVSTMDDVLKTTRDVTGMGVAAAGTIDLQLQTVEKFMNNTTTDINTGLATIAAAANGTMGNVQNFVKTAGNAISGFNKQLDAIKNFSYPVKINVISWEKVGTLFTSPIEHFKALYPIDSMQDVENLMTKIMDILHRINPDIPDFNSLKKLLEDLLRKLQNHVMKLINDLRAKLEKAAGEVKSAIQKAIDEIWDWFKPIVTTVRNVINMLKELAIALKDKMQDVLEDVKEGVTLITKEVQKGIDEVKKGIEDVKDGIEEGIDKVSSEVGKNINAAVKEAESAIGKIKDEVEKYEKELEKKAEEVADNANKLVNEVGSAAENAANEATKALQEKVQATFDEMKKDMPKMPKMNLPAIVKNTLAEPMANAVKNTLKETLDFDISSIVDFNNERKDLVACFVALRTDVGRLQTVGVNLNDILKTEGDYKNLLSLDLNAQWGEAFTLPDIQQIVQQEVLPDLKVWAYGMMSSVQALVNPNAWKKRLDTVIAQLKAEFQNDLGNVTGLISKEGAMRLIQDSSSVKEQLKNEINITDYISILETAVNDVVLPDPEYYYTSFKQCILGILSKLSARIIDEVNKKKEAINSIIEKIKTLPEQIKNNVENLYNYLKNNVDKIVSNVKDAAGATKDQVKAVVEDIIEDIKSTLDSIKKIVEKIPETINNVKDFITNKASNALTSLKNNAEKMLKEIAKNFLNRLEDLAVEIWNKLKNEYIIPFVKYIKNQVIFFVKRIIQQKIQEIISALTDLREDAENGVAKLLNNIPFFKKMHEAQVAFARTINSALNTLPDVKKCLPEGKLTNLNQLPAVINALPKDEAAVASVFRNLSFNIQFEADLPEINVPYYYVTWIQSILSSTVTFVQSDMGLKEILKLVQSLYQGTPQQVKKQIADVLPSLPSLPDNKFTDLLNDVTCSYDLDNMMCNITLLDLKKDKKEAEGAEQKDSNFEWDASLKLQLFIMVGRYSKDGFVEQKKDDQKQIEGETKNDEKETTDVAETTEEDNTVPAIFCTMMLNGQVMLTFRLGDNHTLKLNGSGHIGAAELTDKTKDVSVGFCISKKDRDKGITSMFHAFGSTKSLGALLYGEFGRNKDAKGNTTPANLIESKYLDLKIGDYPLVAYVLYNDKYPDSVNAILKKEGVVDGFTAGVGGSIKDFEFILKLRENKFFATLLKDDISAKFDLDLLYDYKEGFKMDGGYSFHIDIDCNNKEIGPLKLSSLGVDLGSVKNDLGTLQLGLGSTFSIKFGDSVTMSFENLGIGASLNIVKKDEDGKFTLGDLDFGFKFKFPEGIGVAIDCPAVKGAAVINYNDATGELFGALELDVLEKFGVSAMLIMDLGIVEGHYFSMVAMLSTRFSPGIPLGMGFSLTAIGGILGLQRMLDYDAIREAVHSGSLESVFFVEDVMNHIADMRKAAEKIFPAKREQFFLGLLGQISYEPVVKCSFGLMFQAPDPTSFIIVGALKVGIEGTDVIRINVAFSGEINLEKGLQFDASLYDSEIVGIRLEGDMAFRLFWGGQTKGFLMSIGGFHPAYKPEAGMNVSDMRRLSMKLDYNVLKVGLETYLAVTSNTFQIGAHLDIKVGWDQFGIIGYAGFDALFQFDPFMFMFDIEAGMAVMVAGCRVLSVDLALSLSGPRPWHAKGKASFSFLFIPVSVSFDVTWGKKKQELPQKQIAVLEVLQEQIANQKNWAVNESVRKDTDVLLIDYSGEQQEVLVLSPSGVLTFNQNAVPMELQMDLCNDAVPTDYNKVKLDKVKLNGKSWEILNKDENEDDKNLLKIVGETVTGDFAPALYVMMDDRKKLRTPSYKKYASGFELLNGDHRTMGNGTSQDITDYEVMTSAYKTHESGTVEMYGVSNYKVTESNGEQQVAYAKNDSVAFGRYVELLDSIQ